MAPIQLHADPRTRLRVYLNDHLAGATAGRDLARRCLSSNRGTPLGQHLGVLVEEIEEDRVVLERLLQTLGMPIARPKLLFAAAAERIGRLKLNGQLAGYSDLARLLELEGLCAGVHAKRSLWRSLRQIADEHPAVRSLPLDELEARADRQRSDLEDHRLAAARRALKSTRP